MQKFPPKLLIGHGRFSTLLSLPRFIEYCRKRDTFVTDEELEFLELKGLFYPTLRVHRPPYRVKIQRNRKQSTYTELGVVEADEVWKGPTITEFSFPYFSHPPDTQEWTKEKLLYTPDETTFRPWKEFRSNEVKKIEKVEHYYSVFQLYPLYFLLKSFRFPYSTIDLLRIGERKAKRHFKAYLRHLAGQIESDQDRRSILIAKVCQAISSRYLPFAEQIGPTVRTETSVNPFDKRGEFNIFEYSRKWDAEKVCRALGITSDNIKKDWENLVYAMEDSPISRWRELINLVNPDRKKELKGSVLRGEDFSRMARMLDLFYFDLTGEHLSLGEVVPDTGEIKSWYGVNRDDFQYKEFLVNRYGLNPRPSLILMVEGDGEFQEIPKLAEWFLMNSLVRYKIQIINLKTIGTFTSDKMERFIDHNHSLQTIVYFVLDNENNSLKCRDKLVGKTSQYEPTSTLTKPEFFKIWERNIEFDNFTDEELAIALTEVSENRQVFSDAEVAEAREKFGSRGDPLSTLFENKTGYGLKKKILLSLLCELVKTKPSIIVNGKKECRPILKVIRDFSRLALRNYQPTRLSRWTEAQTQGWIRNPKDGRE